MVKASKALGFVLFGLLAMLVVPSLASATWPGQNGKIFFVCREAGSGFSGQDICSINPDGSGLVNLTQTPALAEQTPQASKDGKQVTFTRGDGSDDFVWAMNADGTNAHQVSTLPGDGPSWTPDGRIAYRAKVDASNYEFQVISSTGGTGTFLRAATGNSYAPRYRTDGVWLYGAFTPIPPLNTFFSLQIFVVSDGGENQVTPFVANEGSNNQPSWSPDGSRIFYWRATDGLYDDIYSVSSSGGTEVQVTDTKTEKENWPQLSPDGTKLLWEQQDAQHDFFHKHLVIGKPDGSGRTPIPTPTLDAAMTPVWAPAATSTPVAAFTATAPRSVKKGKPVPVTLRCSGETRCAVIYRATVTVPRKGKKPQSFKIKAKSITLNAKTNKVVSVKSPNVANAPIAKALKANRVPTIEVTASARQPAGPQIRKVNLSVKVKR